MTIENNPQGTLTPSQELIPGRVRGRFAPGNQFSKGHGRPPGRRDNFTIEVREALAAAFDRVGGVDYLVRVAEENPAVFVALLAKGSMIGDRSAQEVAEEAPQIRVTVEYV